MSAMVDIPPIDSLKTCLLDLDEPISKRTHAAFYLRTQGSDASALIICEALKNRKDGALMRHELAYILGQMQKTLAVPSLTAILDDESDDVLVRHESAEALGAIGHIESLEILRKHATSSYMEIAETCQIAIDLIVWRQEKRDQEKALKAVYLSVDPAPPFAMSEKKSVKQLGAILLNESLSLFLRYRAMFSLRDLNTDESALALVKGLKDKSALFRHEVAYVLGQMERSVTIAGLSETLRDQNEHRMVRHEAAEALGNIGGSTVEALLNDFRADGEVVVQDSCHVALDNMNYWAAWSSNSSAAACDT